MYWAPTASWRGARARFLCPLLLTEWGPQASKILLVTQWIVLVTVTCLLVKDIHTWSLSALDILD